MVWRSRSNFIQESNLRQRVLGNTNPVKLGRCFKFLNEWYGIRDGSAKKVGLRIKELERIYGIKQGGSGFYGNRHTENNIETPNNSETLKTQEQLAKEMGFSVDTLNNYKKLTEMIPELEELVDTGIATPTTALAIMQQSLM